MYTMVIGSCARAVSLDLCHIVLCELHWLTHEAGGWIGFRGLPPVSANLEIRPLCHTLVMLSILPFPFTTDTRMQKLLLLQKMKPNALHTSSLFIDILKNCICNERSIFEFQYASQIWSISGPKETLSLCSQRAIALIEGRRNYDIFFFLEMFFSSWHTVPWGPWYLFPSHTCRRYKFFSYLSYLSSEANSSIIFSFIDFNRSTWRHSTVVQQVWQFIYGSSRSFSHHASKQLIMSFGDLVPINTASLFVIKKFVNTRTPQGLW